MKLIYREDQSETADSIMQQTKEGLLKGLGDDDLQCRCVLQFQKWVNWSLRWKKSFSLFFSILKKMFKLYLPPPPFLLKN